jgi:hypothetical protein
MIHVLFFQQVKQCSAIPSALQWVEVTDITLAVEQGGSVNCVKHIKLETSLFFVRYIMLETSLFSRLHTDN